MNVYLRIATAVRDEVAKSPDLEYTASDTPWLDFIKELIGEYGPMLLKCFVTPTAAAAEANKPGLMTRARLRLAVRRKLVDDDTVRMFGDPLFRSVVTVGKTLTEADFAEMASDT